MIYLDYSKATQTSIEALDTYARISKEFFASCNGNNELNKKSKELFDNTTKEISTMLNVMPSEIIYTTGAMDANNRALIGVAMAYRKKGKHIIVSKLEQKSFYDICTYLESIGFEISYVDNDDEGLIIFDDLKRLIRDDTILVSISAVNYETGVRQPLKMLRQIIKKENEQTLFHSDLSQALGKTSISFRDIDLGSVSSNLIYGPSGIGFLYKSNYVKLSSLKDGKNNYCMLNEFSLPLIVSLKDALKTAIKDLDKKERYVSLLNERITSKMVKIDGIKLNKTKYSIPYILSISFDDILSETMNNVLSKNDIYVSTNNNNEVNASVLAIYNDLNRSKQTMRISLSHLTTVLEVNRFLEIFELEYNKLKNLVGGLLN